MDKKSKDLTVKFEMTPTKQSKELSKTGYEVL